MKRLFLGSLLLLSFCSVYGQNVVDSSLVAYWPFDGNTNDVGIYGNDGIAYGPNVTYVPGISGQALFFNGIDDFVTVNGSVSLHNLTKEYTIAGWVKPYGVPAYYVPIVTKGNNTDIRTPIAVLYRSPETNPYIRITGKDLPFDLVNLESVTQACPLNEWTFFTWTFSLGKVSIYKNADWVAEQQFGFTELDQNNLPMDIGRDRPGFNTEFLFGVLDELCIFNKALLPFQIHDLYRAKLASQTKEAAIEDQSLMYLYPNPASKKLVVEYTFQEPGTTILEVYDVTGKVVKTSTLNALNYASVTMNTESLPEGLYNISLRNGHERLVKSFLVLKD